jgi:SAM-dependent methyltransferase
MLGSTVNTIESTDLSDLSSDRAGDPFAAVSARLTAAAGPGAYWLAGYGKYKIRLDPIYRAVLPLIPPGAKVLDLGCGVGLLGLLLTARGLENDIHGIEWDAPKAHFARQLAESIPAIRVECGDLLKEPWPECSVITLLDVLHYLPPAQQRALLFRAASHLPEGGRLLVRVMDGRAGGVAILTRLCEQAAVKIGWNRAENVHWRPLSAVRADLLEADFVLPPATASAGQAIGNQLLIGEKEGSSRGAPFPDGRAKGHPRP